MNGNRDRLLAGASFAYAGVTVVGSAVAVRDELPGQPFGISIPLPVRAGVLAGWGAGVAAPWPMPAVAVITAATAWRQEPRARPGAMCALVGLGCIIGTLAEPVTWRPRSWSTATSLAIGLNVAAAAALIGAGLRHSAIARAFSASW